MGTTSRSRGTKGKDTPEVSSWTNIELPSQGTTSLDSMIGLPSANPIASAEDVSIPPAADPNRYMAARVSFTKFVNSGGLDTTSLRRAVSNYVSNVSGGSKNATKRMGASRRTASRLLGLLTDISQRGVNEVLKSLNLSKYYNKSTVEILSAFSDFLCTEEGTVDVGIARRALEETIVDIVETEIGNLDDLTPEQIKIIFEKYLTHSIEIKMYNEIATRADLMTIDEADSKHIEDMLFNYIEGAVSDAMADKNILDSTIATQDILKLVDSILVDTFSILSKLGN